MTWGILTTELGGTDITDGNVLYSKDLVDTFNTATNEICIGDFEVDIGGWTYANIAGTTTGAVSSTYSKRGNNSYKITGYASGQPNKAKISITKDLTNKTLLIINYYPEYCSSGDTLEVTVNGDTLYTNTSLGNSEWATIELDITGYTGDNEIIIYFTDTYDGNTPRMYLDDIRLKNVIASSDAGN